MMSSFWCDCMDTCCEADYEQDLFAEEDNEKCIAICEDSFKPGSTQMENCLKQCQKDLEELEEQDLDPNKLEDPDIGNVDPQTGCPSKENQCNGGDIPDEEMEQEKPTSTGAFNNNDDDGDGVNNGDDNDDDNDNMDDEQDEDDNNNDIPDVDEVGIFGCIKKCDRDYQPGYTRDKCKSNCNVQICEDKCDEDFPIPGVQRDECYKKCKEYGEEGEEMEETEEPPPNDCINICKNAHEEGSIELQQCLDMCMDPENGDGEDITDIDPELTGVPLCEELCEQEFRDDVVKLADCKDKCNTIPPAFEPTTDPEEPENLLYGCRELCQLVDIERIQPCLDDCDQNFPCHIECEKQAQNSTLLGKDPEFTRVEKSRCLEDCDRAAKKPKTAVCIDATADNNYTGTDTHVIHDPELCIYTACKDKTADNYEPDQKFTSNQLKCKFTACKDNTADHFETDPKYTHDQAKCKYTACKDKTADYFETDPKYTHDQAKCKYTACKDNKADNYQPDDKYTSDPFKCKYTACKDTTADNYDPVTGGDPKYTSNPAKCIFQKETRYPPNINDIPYLSNCIAECDKVNKVPSFRQACYDKCSEVYNDTHGCMDDKADNFDNTKPYGAPGLCKYTACKDVEACNYDPVTGEDPKYTHNPEKCKKKYFDCDNPEAQNYKGPDPCRLHNEGDCIYDDPPNEGSVEERPPPPTTTTDPPTDKPKGPPERIPPRLPWPKPYNDDGGDFDCYWEKGCTEYREGAEKAFQDQNEYRIKEGLQPQTWDERLYRAAFEQASWMCENRRMAHLQMDPNNPTENVISTPQSRVTDAGYISGPNVDPNKPETLWFNQATENVGATIKPGDGSNSLNQFLAEVPPNDGHLKNIRNPENTYGAWAIVGCYTASINAKPPNS